MYCKIKGLEPIPIGHTTTFDAQLMGQAIKDFKGEFADLNDKQRRLIASCV